MLPRVWGQDSGSGDPDCGHCLTLVVRGDSKIPRVVKEQRPLVGPWEVLLSLGRGSFRGLGG